MFRTRLLWLTLAVLLAAVQAWSMMIAIAPEELVGTADIIVAGTITEVREVPGAQSWFGGEATVAVEEVIKGNPGKRVTFRYSIPPKMPPGMVIMDHGGIVLKPQQQQIFFLQRSQFGLSLSAGFQGMKPVGEIDKTRKLVEELPVTVTLEEPVTTLYFGQELKLTMVVKNNGKTAIQYYNPTMEGFFYSQRMGTYLPVSVKQEQQPGIIAIDGMVARGDVKEAVDTTVPAGGEKTLTFIITCTVPESWRVFTPDTYFMTPVAVRARLFLQPQAGDPNNRRGYNVTTSWMKAMIGYPVVEDEAAPAEK